MHGEVLLFFAHESPAQHASRFATARAGQQVNHASAERDLRVEGAERRVRRVEVRRVAEISAICTTGLAGCRPLRSACTPPMAEHDVDASATPLWLGLHAPSKHPRVLGWLNTLSLTGHRRVDGSVVGAARPPA